LADGGAAGLPAAAGGSELPPGGRVPAAVRVRKGILRSPFRTR
jgi:hypothetical protein